MGGAALPGRFNQIQKTDDIALNVKVGIFERVPHPGLGSQMHDGTELMKLKQIARKGSIRYVTAEKLEAWLLSQKREPRLLQSLIVVWIKIVHADDWKAGVQKPHTDMKANK